ncbi:MAG: secondary thiamine-phosphate synthase enzyme YjbQ [Syntrophomonadaceae bacterium]|nr:secondary thiamine-phosphate synthase enzyme YjbQ [Syntrophomonadaceae bacterium]
MVHKITVQSGKREQMIDITDQVVQFVRHNAVQEGAVLVYCPHTTAAITINENADPDVVHDILMALDKVYPHTCPEYRHREGNSAAHLKASTIGSSQFIPVAAGRLLLGTWQGIYFCEFDGPRQRSCYLKLLPD